jgi:DNA-binding beta-propeller fold protein YncE
VKPANLLVDNDRHVYVSDFGLAKAVLTRSGGTRTGHWVGTLDYVAPEQIRGGRIDARADVYALGGVLHYALTGHVPFEREGDEAKLWAQLSAPPPIPSALRRGLPAPFDLAVARAMAKQPDERYPSAGDLGRAATAAAVGRTPTEPERMVARGAAAPDAAPTEPGLAADASTRTAIPRLARRRRRRAPIVAGLAVIAAVGRVGAGLLARDEPDSRAAREPTPTATPNDAPAPTASPTRADESLPRVAKTIRNIGDRPAGIALAGGDLWVASARGSRLTRVDAASGRERRRHPDVGSDVTAIVDYSGSVWVALGAERQVLRLDGRTGAVRRRISVATYPRRLAVDRHGIWIGNGTGDREPGVVLRYDRATGALLQTIVVNEGVGGLTAGGGVIWVVKRSSNLLTRLEPGSTTLVDWANLPGAARSIRYAADALWIVIDGEDTIVRVDADGGGQVTGVAGRSPTQAVVAGGTVYVASRNDNTVVVLDPATLEPVAEPLKVRLNPQAMTADSRSVWVTGLGSNTLTRIDYR